MIQTRVLDKIRIRKIVKVLFGISAISMLGLSTMLISANAVDSYAYVAATPTVVEKGQTTTLTLIGYIYEDGKYNISVEFMETDMFEDLHQGIDHLWTAPVEPDLSVGKCTTSITVKTAARFECSAEVTPSELTKGDSEDEADWTEYYAMVSINGEEMKTGGLELVYCSYCSSDVEIKGEDAAASAGH